MTDVVNKPPTDINFTPDFHEDADAEYSGLVVKEKTSKGSSEHLRYLNQITKNLSVK